MKSRRLLSLALAAPLAALALGGCADPHYNLDVRNMSSQTVNLDLISTNAKIGGGEARAVASGQVGPGTSISLFTSGSRGDKARLEARPQNDPDAAPATLEIKSGLSNIDVIPADPGAKAPLRLREAIRP